MTCITSWHSPRGGTRRSTGLTDWSAPRGPTSRFARWFFLTPPWAHSPAAAFLSSKAHALQTRPDSLACSSLAHTSYLLPQAPAAELVLGPGDLLYLPSFWFHYIVSLDKSVQCNSRAGDTDRGEFEIASCMRSHTTETAAGF
jgi:hypothetical protein